MSVITKCLHENKKSCPYLSWSANEEMKQNTRKWSSIVRSNIFVEPKQIHQLIVSGVDLFDSEEDGKIKRNIDCCLKIRNIFVLKKHHIFPDPLCRIHTVGVCYRPFADSDKYIVQMFLQAV